MYGSSTTSLSDAIFAERQHLRVQRQAGQDGDRLGHHGACAPAGTAGQESFLQNFINHCARKLYRQDADLPFLIDDVLAAIGEYLQADRAYIFEFSDDVVRNTFEWCREGVVPQRNFWPMSLWASLPAGCPTSTPTSPS